MAALIKILMILIFALSFYYIQKGRADKAYTYLFIPSIFLLPMNIFIKLPGFIFLNCYKAALLPLIIWAVFYKKDKYRFDLVDSLILSFIFMTVVSSSINYDMKTAVSIAKEYMVTIYGIFVVSKIVLSYNKIREKVLITLISVTSIMSLMAVVEFFTGFYFQNIFKYISYFILVTLPRWGFHRSMIFTSHPIILGIIFSISIVIALYLYKNKKDKIYLWIMLLNIIGIITTLARGPMAIVLITVIIVAAVLNGVTYKSYIVMFLIGIILYFAGGYAQKKYFVEEADSHETASIQYRTKLYDNYKDQMYAKPIWGNGPNIVIVDNQKSVDNYYLQTSLAYGIPTALLFIAICLTSIYRSIVKYKKVGILGAAIAMVMLNYTSVWNGDPSTAVLMILFGAISGEYLKIKTMGKAGNFDRIL